MKNLISLVYDTGISLQHILVDRFGGIQAELSPFDIIPNSRAFVPNSLESLSKVERPSELPLPAPRGLSRKEAAAYIGISPSGFDAFVSDGTMPKPVRLGRRRVWDIQALDKAFSSQDDMADPFANVFEE